MVYFLGRLFEDRRGMETIELALGIALFAMIVGFGFFVLGDALANYFATLGNEFAPPPATP